MAVQADVSNRAAVESMFEKVWNELGPIDILVNNAGIETIVPFLELTDEQWTRVTDVDLRAPWLCSQVFCRRVIAEGRKANIVNIGSVQAAKILPGRTHYAPAKLAIEALTRNTSAEMTPRGDTRELRASRFHRYGYDGMDSKGPGHPVECRGPDLGRPRRRTAGHRESGGVFRLRRIGLRHRSVDPRRWWLDFNRQRINERAALYVVQGVRNI